MAGEGSTQLMMQNLFGDEWEEEEDDEEILSERQGIRHHPYIHDDVVGKAGSEGEGQAEGQGESEGELHETEYGQQESEGERNQSSPEREISDQRVDSDEKEDDGEEEEEDYGEKVVTSRRRDMIPSESGRSDADHYVDNADEEVVQTSRARRSPSEEEEHDQMHVPRSAENPQVFGDSDEDEMAGYVMQNASEQEPHRSPVEEEGSYENDLRPEDVVQDGDAHYESEEDVIEQKSREKPVGPPLDLDIPLRPPPGRPEKMNIIRVSNIMGIDPKPFDPKTYVDEDVFVTDESGAKKRIRLEDNIVRWRNVRNRDGSLSYESNARFVRWSDGSLQLLIGNEVLDITVQEAQHDQTHLFLRHGKGILQSQGRLLKKMRFMPSSLTSKSHRLLTALVDSRHKKVYKVKNCITDIDPEKEKEEKEKAEGQTIRANELLHRKREKVSRKYMQTIDRGRQLSPGFLEGALEEEDEREDYEARPAASRRRLEEDLETRAERRILNAKRPQAQKDTPRKPSLPSVTSSRIPVEEYSASEREESEYESTGEEDERPTLYGSPEQEQEEEEEEEEYDGVEKELHDVSEGEEDEEPKQRAKAPMTGFKTKEVESEVDSPPRKPSSHRRMKVVIESDED